MITYRQGNLLDATSGVIIHGCNAKGVMGSGVAKAIREKYPGAYESYKNFEQERGLRLGGINIVRVTNTLLIANAITQENYGRDPKIVYVSYGAIHLAFEKLHKLYGASTIFHIPKIGAGLGNGDWNTISFLIELACPKRDIVCWEL